MKDFKQWDGFAGRLWKEGIDVRDFIQNNYTPYDGDEKFLEGPTEATDRLWGKLQELQKEERAKGGVLDMETEVVSGLTAYGPGYINEEMKVAASFAIASLVSDEELNADYILPEAFDKRIGKTVAEAVKKAAVETGVARI